MSTIDDYLKKIDAVAPHSSAPESIITVGDMSLTVGNGVWNPAQGKTSPMFVEVLRTYCIDNIRSAIDIGTGSGVLALLLQRRGVPQVTACDTEQCSVDMAQRNAQQIGANITVIQSDMFRAIQGTFDLAVFNAPATHPLRRGQAYSMPSLWSPEENILQRFLSADEWQHHKTPTAKALVTFSRFDDFDPLPPDVLQDWNYRILTSCPGEHSESGIMEIWQ